MALRTVTRKIGSKLLPRFSPASLLHSHATSFGFKEVREEEKSQMVGNVFSNVASNYDTMNDLMSAGLHRLWKDRLVSKLNPFPGMNHLDVAGGTGDVAFRILDRINSIKHRALLNVLEDDLQEETKVYVCDINPNMLNVGKKRALQRGLGEDKSLLWVEGDAEALSFGDNTMDGYTIAFGIRNVTHIEKALSEAYRVLKRGGRFLCLELSHVEVPVFKDFYDFYSFSIIPTLGELVAGDRESYQYLVESIRRFPPQETFASMIADAGFQKVEYENLVGGVSQSVLKATDSSSIHGIKLVLSSPNSLLKSGTQVEFGPTTPLPDKKLLVFILDRLQKKDTRGVFSEPVDPEELPDYHEIIENPMDFGTVREKLDRGAYANLEQFEKDVFLISSNAMQYNAPDTIYFRQARSIQELAKKDFENLRQDNTGDGGEPKPKIARRGRPPGSKTMKKSIDLAPVERLGPQYFSETTLPPGGETSSLSNGYNLRKGPASYKFRTADALNRAPHGSLGGDTNAKWLSELENEFPASVLRSVLRYGKKQFPVDENRRETYRQSLASEHESSELTGLEGEWNQLMAVGVAAEEHGYARSMARFAANLGPVAWKIASKRIGSVLPIGVEFGPGWVGENESSRLQQFSFRQGEDKVQCNPASDDHKDRLRCQSTSGLNSVADRYLLQNGVNMENCREFNSQNGLASLNSGVSGIRPVPPFQNSMIHSGNPGLNSRFMSSVLPQPENVNMPATLTGMSSSTNTSVPSHHQMVGMFSERNMNTQSMPIGDIDSNEARSEISSRSRNPLAQAQPQLAYGGETSWQGLSMNNKQVSYSLPPDLNVEFGAPGSPSSLIQIGMPQQPDLALQL